MTLFALASGIRQDHRTTAAHLLSLDLPSGMALSLERGSWHERAVEGDLEAKTNMAAENDAHDNANDFEDANGCVNLHDSKEVCESFAFL